MSRLPDEATKIFEAQRPRLLRLAYRMLGSISEAEDVVQDAWLRWERADRTDIQSPPAFLSRVVTRLCLDAMKSARARRETYFGTWLPEPIAEEPDAPDHDDLTLTLMLALERLSPLERAASLSSTASWPTAPVTTNLRRRSEALIARVISASVERFWAAACRTKACCSAISASTLARRASAAWMLATASASRAL